LLLLVAALLVCQNLRPKSSQDTATPESSTAPTDESESSSAEASNVEQSPIVFKRDGKIILLDGIDGEEIEIDEGDSPSINYDQMKVAYIKMDEDNNIHIHNIETGQKENVITEEGRLRSVQWSPNGKYLVTNSGTSAEGCGAIYEYPSGNKSAAFGTIGSGWEWLNNAELVFVEPQEVTPERPYESGLGMGLSKISAAAGGKQVLAQVTSTEDYGLIEIIDGVIFFSKTEVADSSYWVTSDERTVTYWKMSGDGAGKEAVKGSELTKEKVAAVASERYPEYELHWVPDRNTNFPNWVIFSLYKGGDGGDSAICIADLDDLQNTLKQIATGAYPDW
jgi:WD40 repeat protein